MNALVRGFLLFVYLICKVIQARVACRSLELIIREFCLNFWTVFLVVMIFVRVFCFQNFMIQIFDFENLESKTYKRQFWLCFFVARNFKIRFYMQKFQSKIINFNFWNLIIQLNFSLHSKIPKKSQKKLTTTQTHKQRKRPTTHINQ
jgi:hypothetical protein